MRRPSGLMRVRPSCSASEVHSRSRPDRKTSLPNGQGGGPQRDRDPTALRPRLLEVSTHGQGAPHRTHCSRRMKSGAAPDRTTPRACGPGPCRVAPIPAWRSTGTRRPADPARARSDRRRGPGGRGTRQRVPPLPAGEVPSTADGRWPVARSAGTSPNPRAVRNAVTSAPATTVPSSGMGERHERRDHLQARPRQRAARGGPHRWPGPGFR